MSFRTANDQLVAIKGKLVDVPLSIKDCHFRISFAMVDQSPHGLLLGTSFMMTAKAVVAFKRTSPSMYLEDGHASCTVPITFHRDQPSIKELSSRRECWPEDPMQPARGRACSEDVSISNGAHTSAPVVLSVRPSFSKVLSPESKAVMMAGCATTEEDASVESDIEKMIEDTTERGEEEEEDVNLARKKPVVLSLRQVTEAERQDKCDWMIKSSIFSQYMAQYGPYTVDACADPNGDNALLPRFWSDQDSCITADWSRENTWCNPPFHKVESILQQYMKCKANNPNKTSATFVVPMWTTAPWWQTIQEKFRIVEYFPPYSKVFTASPVKGTDARRLAGPIPWPVVIAVSEYGPIPGPEGGHRREGDLHPVWIDDVIKKLRSRADPADVGPVEQVQYREGLSQEQLTELKELLRNFGPDLWANDVADLGQPIKLVQHHIYTSDEAPAINHGPPRSNAEWELLRKWTLKSLDACVLGRSTSQWCSPPVVVYSPPNPASMKPEKEPRVCHNFGKVNDKTWGDGNPCPNTFDVLQKMEGGNTLGQRMESPRSIK